MPDTPGATNWAKLLFLGVIWGASFMAVSLALKGFPPMTIAALRITIGAISLLAVIRVMGIGLPSLGSRQDRIIWACALGMGFFSNALPFTLLSWGQTYVASGFAGVCMAVVPLFVLPLAHMLVPGESMTLRRAISFLIGFAGVVVLIGLDAFRSAGTDFESLARLACLGASLCYAIGSIVTRLCPQVNMLSLSAAALLCGAAMMAPVALWIEGRARNADCPAASRSFVSGPAADCTSAGAAGSGRPQRRASVPIDCELPGARLVSDLWRGVVGRSPAATTFCSIGADHGRVAVEPQKARPHRLRRVRERGASPSRSPGYFRQEEGLNQAETASATASTTLSTVLFSSSASSHSAITRISGSVPDLRINRRPLPVSAVSACWIAVCT